MGKLVRHVAGLGAVTAASRALMQRTKLDDVESWLGELAKVRTGEFVLGPPFMRPYHFAVLASEVHRMGATDLIMPEGLVAYAARMRLWQAIGLDPPKEVNERNPGGRFHPLSPIFSESSAEDLSRGVADVFRAAGTSDKRTLDAIGITLSEIFGNRFFHSHVTSELCGLACAQTWPAAKLAQVAVADIGVGIRGSLTRNPKYNERLVKENAPELATELGVTGNPEGKHSGYGLTVARQLMERHDGNFLLLSGSECFRAINGQSRARKLQSPWPGTIVIVEWDTSVPLDISNVYRNWPHEETDDDFF